VAVDYFHRLLVRGPREQVHSFRRRLHREYPRTIGGETWTEIVAFSFAALYEVAPAARRVESEVPFDPYELSAWPIRALDRRRSEVRYQFQTRNLEMLPFVRPLARALPALTFTLTTLCLDDSSIESYRLSGRNVQKWTLPDQRRDFHWDRARRKFGLAGDDVYDDHEADQWAEEEMLAEALGHWDEAGLVRRRQRPKRYRWWNAIRLRDLETERKLSLLQLGLFLDESEPKKRPAGKRRKASTKRRQPPRHRR
jgi:hypothetical protein